MTYDIFEGNMERLQKKLTTIQNKCNKYGCGFHFEELGETFKEVKDESGNTHTVRFITVEAEGTARVTDWEFIATIEHNKPMNIIRNFRSDIDVPHEYFTADTYCEHCKTRRYRKDTYIIRNTETGEFKQVGKSCLKDFTNGLSAAAVAQYISWFDELIEAEAPSLDGYKTWDETHWVLMNAIEAVRMYGYVKPTEFGISTKQIVLEQVHEFGDYHKRIMAGFNPNNSALADAILSWVSSQEDDYGYITNLKAACGRSYCERRDYGLICSAVIAYNKAMKLIEKKATKQNTSEWVGVEKSRIELKNVSLYLVTGWSTEFGYNYLYKMVDSNGNEFIWKTGKWLSNTNTLPETISLVGTVKNHSEYNGVKQTELTRCKII